MNELIAKVFVDTKVPMMSAASPMAAAGRRASISRNTYIYALRLYAPREVCQHGTHTDGTAYTRGTYSRDR